MSRMTPGILMEHEWRQVERERDEARAIARRLADALSRYVIIQGHEELLERFYALPWAKEHVA